MEELLKLLELAERTTGADSATLVLGAREPTGPGILSAPLGRSDGRGVWRLVLRFDRAPGDLATKQARLDALVGAFGRAPSTDELPLPPTTAAASGSKREALREALARICSGAKAHSAVIIDDRSPVLWGCSAPVEMTEDVEALEQRHSALEGTCRGESPERLSEALARAQAREAEAGEKPLPPEVARWAELAPKRGAAQWRTVLDIAAGVSRVRRLHATSSTVTRWVDHGAESGVFARALTPPYWLVMLFDGPFSELKAEGSAVRGLRHLEALVLGLPPVDPTPKGGRVFTWRRRDPC